MANNIGVITKYLPEVIDKVFVAESKTEILENGSKWIDLNFKEAGYVKIYDLLMDGLGDYYRANSLGEGAGQYQIGDTREVVNRSQYDALPTSGLDDADVATRTGFSRGSYKGQWELYKLRFYRSKQFLIDQMDDEETAGTIIANALKEFVRTKVVPEVDEIRFATLVENAVNGETAKDYAFTDMGTEKIIDLFTKVFAELADLEIPEEEQVIFVSNILWAILVTDPTLTRYITQSDYKSESGLTFKVNAFMGRPIITVPKNRFYSNPVLGDNGYYAGANSKPINFIVCSKKAIVPIVKLDYTKIFTPAQVQDFIGYKVNFAIYHDAIVPKNKKPAIWISLGSTGATSNTLNVEINGTAGAHTVGEYFTNPFGLNGSLVVKDATADPFTVGASTNVSGLDIIDVGSALTDPSTSNHSLYFALVRNGKVVAKSGAYLTKE